MNAARLSLRAPAGPEAVGAPPGGVRRRNLSDQRTGLPSGVLISALKASSTCFTTSAGSGM